jgi:uncharacterized surface protein with fasciclin (FAS1) repeats
MGTHSSLRTVHRMKSYVAAAAVLAVIAAACGESADENAAGDSLAVVDPTMPDAGLVEQNQTQESIFDVLQDDSRFSTFSSLLDSAGLGMTLSGPGPFTVFAPTNEAMATAGTNFQDLLDNENEDRLRDILLHHMFNGERMAADLSSSSIRTLAGGELQVSGSDDSLRVGGARVVDMNVDAANGVIHAIDRTLTPETDDASY